MAGGALGGPRLRPGRRRRRRRALGVLDGADALVDLLQEREVRVVERLVDERLVVGVRLLANFILDVRVGRRTDFILVVAGPTSAVSVISSCSSR